MTSAPRHLRIALFGRFGTGNLGNDALLLAAVGRLRGHDPHVDLMCLCNAPAEVERLYGLPAKSIRRHTDKELSSRRILPVRVGRRILDFLRMYWLMRSVDLVMVPGTGVLEGGTRRAGSFVSTLLMTALTARIAGTRVALVSVGVNLSARRSTNTVLRWTMRLAHYRSFRDAHSQRCAVRLGVQPTLPRAYPDLVFGIDLPAWPATQPSSGLVGVGLMDCRSVFFGNDPVRRDAIADGYLESITSLVGWLLDRGKHVLLLTGAWKDEEIAEQVVSRLPRRTQGASIKIARSKSIVELMSYMRHVDFLIASRYHNIVAAMLTETPVISIGYGPKHTELMIAMGLEQFVQAADRIDDARLREQCSQLERSAAKISSQARRTKVEFQDLVNQQWSILGHMIWSELSDRASSSRR